MTIGNALTFIKRGMAEQSLRDRLNTAATLSELQKVLAEEELTFTSFEFEDAVNSSLVKCAEWDEADQLKEFQQWWEMLQSFVSPDGAVSSSCASAGTCTSSNSCSGGCCG